MADMPRPLAQDLDFVLVDEATFEEIPAPDNPGSRCQTCDYWERLDGGREPPDPPDGRAPPKVGVSRTTASPLPPG